jgi:hypothetical protein
MQFVTNHLIWLVPLAFAVGFYFALFLLTALRWEGNQSIPTNHSRPYLNASQNSSNPINAPAVISPVPDNWVPVSSETVKGLGKASKDR